MRPAHLHFLVYKPGFKTLVSQIYDHDDKYIETDVQFGVTPHLIGNYVTHEKPCPRAAGRHGAVVLARPHLRHGARHGALPRPPITGKARASGRRSRISKRCET